MDFDSSVVYPPNVRALWLAEVLGQLARHNVQYAVYWNLQERNQHGLVGLGGVPRAPYHAFRLYSRNLTGRMLPVKGELGRVQAFATLNDDGAIAVLVNNLDLGTAFDVEIVLSGPPGPRKVRLALRPGSITAVVLKAGETDAAVKVYRP